MRKPLQFWMLAALALPALVACGGNGTPAANDNTQVDPTGANLGPAETVTVNDAVTVANENVREFADDIAKKVAFFSDSKTLDSFDNENCVSQSGGSTGSGAGSKEDSGDGGDKIKCENDKFDADEAAKDVKDWFKEHLFNKDLQSPDLSTDKMIVFCLKAEDVCEDNSPNDAPTKPNVTVPDDKTDDPSPKLDEDCVKGLKEVPICLAVTKHGDGALKGQLLVGAKPQVIPMTFVLTKTLFSGRLDLPKAREAYVMLNKAMGEKLDESFPSTVAGMMTFDLLRNADKTLTGKLHIVEALHVGAFDKSDKRFYDVKVAKTADLLKVVLGQANSAVLSAIHTGQIDVGVALDLFYGGESDCSGSGGTQPPAPKPTPDDGSGEGKKDDPAGDPIDCGPSKTYTGALFASLSALGFSVDFSVDKSQGNDSFGVKGLTLGDKGLTVNFDDGKVLTEIVTLTLNKDTKPAYLLDLSGVFDGDKMVLTALPALDVTAGHALAALAKQIEDIPLFMHKGFSMVGLTGDNPKVEIEALKGTSGSTTKPVPAPNDGGGAPAPKDEMGDNGEDFPTVKVISGLLTLKAWGMDGIQDTKVEVKAGQCLLTKKDGDKGGPTDGDKKKEEHFFSQFEAGTCK